MSLRHTYIIDRDEREIGGELVRVATFTSWKEAKAAWDSTRRAEDRNVSMFFARLHTMANGEESCDTLECR